MSTQLKTSLMNPLILFVFILGLQACTSNINSSKPVQDFISNMVVKHQFNEAELNQLFDGVEVKEDIIKKITSPAEAMPWYKYRKLFMTEARIDGGVKFWQENEQVLAAVEQQSGVPAEIIVAIIGVETLYGAKTGKHRIIDALFTLAFAYPPRSQFFQSELENFLLLCREEHKNPLEATGSYAGAMGMPQFMPSSFREYAVDYDKDGRKDIWHNNGDVIASVANYFVKHQWQTGQLVAVPVTAMGENYKSALAGGLKPDLRLDGLESLNLKIARKLPLDRKVKLLSFEQQPIAQKPSTELWLGFDNFYVITRYNHSPLYAMAVYQLSQSILNKKGNTHEQISTDNFNYHPKRVFY
ncbi:MAG: lytic murein transglycosylase B [Methylococcales bacterium]|nr:lytic murein transglycosylase B [Methylococcales bacterium]